MDYFSITTTSVNISMVLLRVAGRSTVLKLLCIMDDWTTKLDSGAQIDAIYIQTSQKHLIQSLTIDYYVN